MCNLMLSLYSVKKTSVRRVLNGAKKPSVQYLQSRLTNLTQSLLLVSHTFKNKRTCITDVTMRTNSKHLYLFYEWIHAVLSIEFMYWGSLTKCWMDLGYKSTDYIMDEYGWIGSLCKKGMAYNIFSFTFFCFIAWLQELWICFLWKMFDKEMWDSEA